MSSGFGLKYRVSFLMETVRLGLANLWLHKLRSMLTALGIILGVAAVIAMVSIGEGKKRDALATLERLGAKNIIIRSQKPPETVQQQSGQQRGWVSNFGITRDDLSVLHDAFGDTSVIVPLKEVGNQVLRGDRRQVSQAFGTIPELKDLANLTLDRGRYLSRGDVDARSMVAVIGQEVAKELFPWEDPLNNTVRIDDKAFTIVGIMGPVGLSGGAGAALVGRDLNLDVHIPITTARAVFGDTVVRRSSGSFQASNVEISEVYVSVETRDRVLGDAARLKRIMEVRHPELEDIGMIVPFELLAQARKQALTWTLILGFIAGISLLVGGIGIMNIMLATVTERTREIGIRRALGATRAHILSQFLVETSVMSAAGGIIGVVLGVGASVLIGWGVERLPSVPIIRNFVDTDVSMPTHVTGWSIILAFAVAAATGLVFGIYPARRAAAQDPIVALRHD